jgi:H+-transporting ATPase
MGLLALSDPPRPDAAQVVGDLQNLGIRVRMVTGDSVPTAKAVAAQLHIPGAVCDRTEISKVGSDCGVFAGVFPEDKFHIVQRLQKRHRITGMTGDGVNDAPALKQAEVGIAVASAMDVAKAAASLVLTRPWLTDVVAAVTMGRRVYQRMLTYTLNKIVKTFQVAMFLSLGLLLFGQFVVTPMLVLLLLFANDFVTMSLAGDNVRPSPEPDHWELPNLIGTALLIAFAWLIYIFGVFLIGRDGLHWPLATLQTMDFLGLVFSRSRQCLCGPRARLVLGLTAGTFLIFSGLRRCVGGVPSRKFRSADASRRVVIHRRVIALYAGVHGSA